MVAKDKIKKQRLLKASLLKPSLLKTSLGIVVQASIGTLALVGAHHLGRKQYHANAQLKDYADGIVDVGKRLLLRKSSKQNSTSNSNNKPPTLATKTLSPPYWISGVADLTAKEFAVVGINEARSITWQTTLPERVHDILVQPSMTPQSSKYFKASCHIAVMGRRPSGFFWILDSMTGEVLHTIKAQANRHFYGHACYSLEGKTLYVTENNTATFDGVIGVYDVDTGYQKTHEFKSHGIGPHEIAMHPDGKTLVIANGGIKTERASRDELNIDTMQPSLAYLNCHDGELLEKIYPEHNQMSVRHLSIHENGTVAIGIQFQGERHLNVPLVLTHRRGDSGFTPLQLPKEDTKGWHRFHHYIASVALDSKNNLLCATSPLGGCGVVFDLTQNEMIGEIDLPDCAGVAVWHNDSMITETDLPHFLISDGQGYLSQITIDNISQSTNRLHVQKVKQPFAFDNHLQRL